MNIKVKKLLSILLVLCVVMSVFIPSSVMAVSNDTGYYKITFDGKTIGSPFYVITDDIKVDSEDVSVNFKYCLEGNWNEVALVNLNNSEILLSMNKGWNNCSVELENYSGELCLGIKVMNATTASSAVVYLKDVAITVSDESVFNVAAAQILQNEAATLEYVSENELPKDTGINDLPAYLVEFKNSPVGKGVWLGGTEGDGKNKQFKVSFDYYLTNAEDGELYVGNARGGAFYDDATGKHQLLKGEHNFNSTVDNYQFENGYPAIGSLKRTNANIYIWNVSVTIGGVDYTKLDAKVWNDGSVKFTTLTYGDIPFDNGSGDSSDEEGVNENAAYLPYENGEYTSPYDVQADTLRNKINELKDTNPKTSRVYYVSNNGSDSNNGRTPETAWATTAKLSSIVSYIPSTVLFERGGVYRGGFEAKENVTYGAYGEGEKPQIYGSLKNYADTSLWTEYADNIWKIAVEGSVEIGNIVFDHGKKVGIKIVKESSFSTLAQKVAHLTEDYTFIYHNGAAYVYLSGGNPAQIHSDIEIVDRALAPQIIDILPYAENITIENLCLKYANFGITAGNYTDNITIRGVEIGYIGGCVMENNVSRWGNGIEFWGAQNLIVENCWIYQCYDAGFTHQADGESPHENIKFTNNLVEFCQYAIEAWNKDCGMSNIEYTDNILRFAGYQVFDPKVRYGSDSSATSLILLGDINGEVNNFKVENNIFDTSYGYIFYGFNEDIEYNNNSYLQQSQFDTYFYTKNEYCDMVPAVLIHNGTVYKAIDEYSFEKGVEVVEPSFKEAIYVMHKDTGFYKVCFNDDIVGGQFCTITDDIAVNSKNVLVNFDYFYTGNDNTADVINLNNSEVLCTLKNGWNSCSVLIDNFKGEMCIGIRNKDATTGINAILYIKNAQITVDDENIINTVAKQFFKIKPAYILNTYEEDIPYKTVPTDKTAYLIDFSNTSAGNPYRKLTADPYGKDKSIKISFSYYLTDAEDKELMVYNLAGGSFQDEVTDKYYLYKGRHNFSYQLDVSNESKNVCVAIGVIDAAKKSKAKLYIWDVSITVGGTEYFDKNTAQWYQGTIPEIDTMQFSDVQLNGDSDNDGIVNILDFIRLQKHLADENIAIKKSNVNINKDSYINVLDTIEFKKILLGCYYN